MSNLNYRVYPAQMETQSFGRLRVDCTTDVGFRPIPNATVEIASTGNPGNVIETITTNEIGRTGEIELPAPPIEYSLEPVIEQPYSEYNIRVTAPGFAPVEVNAAQILPDVTSDQPVSMAPSEVNVASSEIYATWPEATIYANVLAIMSFTLNRVYTEWYRNQGYNFTITSSTAFDHKWMNGRNIYDNIGVIVDSIFNNYLSRPNVRQPILTQYCDGKNVQCPGWMTIL